MGVSLDGLWVATVDHNIRICLYGRKETAGVQMRVTNAFELPVPELLTPPSPADLAEHFKDLGIEEPRAYYGPVGMVH